MLNLKTQICFVNLTNFGCGRQPTNESFTYKTSFYHHIKKFNDFCKETTSVDWVSYPGIISFFL